MNQKCGVKSPALTSVAYKLAIPRLRRTEYESEPSRWRGKRGAKQYQVSGIPLNKMREKEETIQAVVDSRDSGDGWRGDRLSILQPAFGI